MNFNELMYFTIKFENDIKFKFYLFIIIILNLIQSVLNRNLNSK